MANNDLKPTHHPQPTPEEIAAIIKEKLEQGKVIDERTARIIWLYKNNLVDMPQFETVKSESD